MKFVVDEQLPPLLVEWLCAQGHDAVHVRDLQLLSSPDRLIRDGAAAIGAIIVTKDEDFTLLQRPNDPQVLWLRNANLRRSILIERFIEAWPEAHRRLLEGEPLVETTLTP